MGSELGEPDCKLIKPYVFVDDEIQPWLNCFTSQDVFMIHSDKFLTLAEPTPKTLEKYQKLIK